MRRQIWFLLSMIAIGACDDSNGPSDPSVEGPRTITVDASEHWVFVDLAEESSIVSVSTPASSGNWDIGLFATSVTLNGGAAGPGGVQGYCVCQNGDAADAQVMAMTAEGAISEFEGVSVGDVPTAEEAWMSDGLEPAIEGWYAYDVQTHVVSPAPEAVWKLRTADGAGFAKLHVVGIEEPTQAHAGRVTLEFAVQDAAGAPFAAPVQITVDLTGEQPVHVDLQSASVTESGWDVALEGYDVRVNGGVSGDGQAGAVRVDEPFDEIEDAGDLTSGHYAADAYGGVFATDDPGESWYRYNLDGQHQIWPTFNVYLLRRDDEVFKVQLIGYYSEAGDSRHVTLRYERLLP